MGLFKAFGGAIGGMFADQWKDFYTVPDGLPTTAAVFPAVPQGTNAGRGSNTKGSAGVISNGSRILVPEGYGLVLIEGGRFTGFAAEPGGYEWRSDDLQSSSIFAGDGIVAPIIKQSWERFKFGGQPAAQQIAIFVSLKELANNKFGTQSEIYWEDRYLNAQVGAVTRGSYTLKIIDPLVFIKNFLPANYITGGEVFDFTDIENAQAGQLFNEVVGSLAPAFSFYTNDPSKGNRIMRIQQDSVGFAQALSAAVEENYQWRTDRGLEIVKTAIIAIEYDQMTRELLANVQRADALSGSRGNSNLQASIASGFESAGETSGAGGIMGLGIAGGAIGLGGLQQPVTPAATPAPANQPETQAEDPYEKVRKLKGLLDDGIISQEEFDGAKAKLLGL